MNRRREAVVQTDDIVIFLTHTGEYGGAELSLFRYLAHETRRLRAKVVFFQGGPVAENARTRGIPVDVLGVSNGLLGRFNSWWALQKQVRSNKPKLVVANSLRSALTLALVFIPKEKRAIYVREDLGRSSIGILKTIVIGRFLLPRFGSVLVNSESTRASLPGNRSHRVRARVAYPVSGIPESTITASKTHQRTKVSPNEPLRVLSLSRLQPWKGIDLIIEAVSLANSQQGRPIQLVVAGGGLLSDSAYENNLREQSIDLGGQVRFVGHLDDVGPELTRADVLCVGSRTPEPFGQVTVQALARGVAVVASAFGGPVEVMKGGVGGILVEPGSVHGFARALRHLADDQELLHRLRCEASEAARPFTDEKTVEALEMILTSAVKLSRKRT